MVPRCVLNWLIWMTWESSVPAGQIAFATAGACWRAVRRNCPADFPMAVGMSPTSPRKGRPTVSADRMSFVRTLGSTSLSINWVMFAILSPAMVVAYCTAVYHVEKKLFIAGSLEVSKRARVQ